MPTQVPVHIPYRPYAVCPPTNLMNPDGFFVVNMGLQFIEVSVTNPSAAPLGNVRAYIEGVSDPGVVHAPAVQALGDIPAGAAVPARFVANFQSASPGTALVSVIVEADGFVFKRFLKKIFITRVDYHKPSKTYSVVMPQGTMKIHIHNAIMGPGRRRCKDDPGAFLALLEDISYDWVPTPPYEGTRGPFPYEDPWLKIALVILAALLLLGALLYDYYSDGELDGGMVSVSGTFDETEPSVECCTDVSTSATDTEDWVARGLYASVGIAVMAAIAFDGPDLHYRGQEATPPRPGELTLSERVRLQVDYPAAPNLGRKFPIAGKWQYTRTTTGGTYTHEAADERENIHWLQSYEVHAPETHDRMSGPLLVRARFQKPDGSYYKSNELYVSGVLVSTEGVARRFELKDHGIEFDKEAGDGWYTGGYRFRVRGREAKLTHVPEEDRPGYWYLFVLAQDVNTVLQGTEPFEAAHTIGGFVLTPQLELNFDEPCQLQHDAVVHVI
jgi:hypothetical protein